MRAEPVPGPDPGTDGKVYTTRYALIRYRTPEDLERLSRRLKISFVGENLLNLFLPGHKANPKEELRTKVDGIFERVQVLLDMRKRGMGVTIEIYPDQEGLEKAYQKVLGEKRREIAFYVYQTNTIYLPLDQVTEGVLAHEMAHCIIHHYFVIPPPSKVQEVLAQYVDLHLQDEDSP